MRMRRVPRLADLPLSKEQRSELNKAITLGCSVGSNPAEAALAVAVSRYLLAQTPRLVGINDPAMNDAIMREIFARYGYNPREVFPNG